MHHLVQCQSHFRRVRVSVNGEVSSCLVSEAEQNSPLVPFLTYIGFTFSSMRNGPLVLVLTLTATADILMVLRHMEAFTEVLICQ